MEPQWYAWAGRTFLDIVHAPDRETAILRAREKLWQRQGGPLIVERGLIRVIRRPSCLCDPA